MGDRQRRIRKYQADLTALADRMGVTTKQAEQFFYALPFSSIPELTDAHDVLDALEPWRRAIAAEAWDERRRIDPVIERIARNPYRDQEWRP